MVLYFRNGFRDGRKGKFGFLFFLDDFSLFFTPFFSSYIRTDSGKIHNFYHQGGNQRTGNSTISLKKTKEYQKNAYRMGTDLRGGFFLVWATVLLCYVFPFTFVEFCFFPDEDE